MARGHEESRTFRGLPGPGGRRLARALGGGPPFTAGVSLATAIARKLLLSPRTVVAQRPTSPEAEAYRRLKEQVENRRPASSDLVVVTSALHDDGQAAVAANLALALAEDPARRVLLIDADLRSPCLHRIIRPTPRLGWADAIRRGVELDHVVYRLTNHTLCLLPAGITPRDPARHLGSARCRELLRVLRGKFDRVILRAPAVLAYPDAGILADSGDGVLLVVRPGVTSRRAFLAAVETMDARRLIGAVRCGAGRFLADRLDPRRPEAPTGRGR